VQGSMGTTGRQILTAAVTEEQRKACLDSLSFQQIDARLLNIKRAHDRTCNWLFEQLEYKQWLDRNLVDDHYGFLWIKGKPGAGKSTMMKHALFKTKKLLAGAVIISFFFTARGSILEKSTLGMYRSLLLQLLIAISSLQDDFVCMFSQMRKHSDVYEWNIEELQEFLITATKSLQQHRLVCFIDALDECKEDEVRELVDFLEDLGRTAVSSGTSLNICLSSRHYPYIRIQKGIQLTMDGQGGHDKDIVTYVESKFKVPCSKQIDDIRAEILSRASGVFLWVVLVVRMLNKEYDHGQLHALRRRLREIPDELDDLFADILIRDTERRDESILCLQWLLFAQRPLKRTELYFAVLSGTEPTTLGRWDPIKISNQIIDMFILSCSKGLAEVSKAKDHTVQFIHESVRDFFLLRNGLAKLQPNLVFDMVGLSQERLKQCCYQYIIADMFEHRFNDTQPSANSKAAQDLREEISQTFPFLEYAIHNIFGHADAAQGCGVSQNDFLREFESLSFKMRKWINFNNIFQRYPIRRYTPEAKLLYILSEKNLSNLVQALLDNKADVDAIGERYGSAIQAASANGHARIIRLLIDAGANINVVGGEYGNSLTAALTKSHIAVIELLLEEGANQNTKDKDGQMPLSRAAAKRREAIVQLLLTSPKVDPNSNSKNGQTPLWCAAASWYEGAVQLLLANPNVDHNSKDKDGRTPLWGAAANGYKAAVQLLLANPNVDLNSKDKYGRTPLLEAAANGHVAVVQLLLANPNVDLNSKYMYGQTPLSRAAANGHVAVVQLLLANPQGDPDSKDSNGRTPLSRAADNRHIAVVQLLLANPKVDPDSKDKYGQTPLWGAATNGCEAVVQLLLANPKVDPDFKDKDDRTPLWMAAVTGREAVVQLLLANPKVDPNSKDKDGRTPLWTAAANGHEAAVQQLLANPKVDPKVDPNSKDKNSQMPLSWAAKSEHEAVVKLLKSASVLINRPHLSHPP
jgi:ankyrin repeat protein